MKSTLCDKHAADLSNISCLESVFITTPYKINNESTGLLITYKPWKYLRYSGTDHIFGLIYYGSTCVEFWEESTSNRIQSSGLSISDLSDSYETQSCTTLAVLPLRMYTVLPAADLRSHYVLWADYPLFYHGSVLIVLN
jgi:hypothetical protein